jgi:hypothetical protein
MDEPELHPVSLPGFSINLPTGWVTNTTKEGFAGRHDLLLTDSGILRRLPLATGRRPEATVSVSWSRHGLDDKGYSSFFRDAALSSIPNSKVVREATLTSGNWVLTIGSPAESATYAFHSCEPGFTIVVFVDVNTRANANFGLANRIIQSATCSLTEANRKRPEAATRLPREFARVTAQQEQTYFTPVGETLSIGFNAGDLPGSPAFMTLMGALTSHATGVPPAQLIIKEIPLPDGDGRKHRLVSASTGGSLFYEGALWCPKLGMTVMATYLAMQPSDERARQVFDSIYCPGEPGESPPDAKLILDDACNAGNSTACQLLKSYAR